MNGKNILIGLSYIDRRYIAESEEDMRPEKVVRNSKRMPGRKIWLIAAVIAMLLMLVGCGVAYALHLQSLKIGEETYTQNMRYEKDGSTIPPTEKIRQYISVAGPEGSKNQLAAQEWMDFQQSYDPDQSLLKAAGDFQLPAQYNSYYAYTADMLDKIDEICEKYDLKLAGDTAVYQGNDTSVLEQILDFNSVVKENAGLEVELGGTRIEQCGNFNASYNATLTNPSATQEFSFMLTYDYHDKAYFCTRYLTIGDGENVQQWNETLPDGTNVLIVNDKGGDAYILCDREDAFINITISKVGAEWANPGDVMTRGDMKLIAQALNYSVKPNPVEDMAALQKQLEEVWQSQEAIVIDPVAEAERQRKYEENTRLDSYGDLIQRMRDNEAYFVENCNLTYENFWDTMEYALWDVNGDGREELIFGRDGHICEIWTMQDGKTAGFMGSWYEGYLCEGNIYEDYVFLDGQPYHYYYRLGSGTEFSSILEVYYDTYYGTWMLKDFESGTEMTQITEERAKEIMASFPRISLEMKPVREFPLD